jgi:hypothetical protein
MLAKRSANSRTAACSHPPGLDLGAVECDQKARDVRDVHRILMRGPGANRSQLHILSALR